MPVEDLNTSCEVLAKIPVTMTTAQTQFTSYSEIQDALMWGFECSWYYYTNRDHDYNYNCWKQGYCNPTIIVGSWMKTSSCQRLLQSHHCKFPLRSYPVPPEIFVESTWVMFGKQVLEDSSRIFLEDLKNSRPHLIMQNP